MHNAEEFLCRFTGTCERKQPGNGFARSFNRGDHEKRVHHIFQENTRSKGRPKNTSSETSNAHSSLRRNSAHRKLSHRDNNGASDESSTSTIGATVPTSPKSTRLPKYPSQVTTPLGVPSMDSYMVFAGLQDGTNFGSPPDAALSIMPNQAQVMFPGAKRPRVSKAGVKSSSTRGAGQTSKRRQEYVRQWTEHVHKLRTLASSLSDVPDSSSGLLVHSIGQETGELLRIICDSIDSQPIENPRDMDDQELRQPPSQTFNWHGGMEVYAS
jgi:hypothetical protein